MVKADTNGNTEDENLRKIFVGGLSSNTTEESLKAFYETFGEVTDVVVMKDAQTQRTRGFGFVTFGAQTYVDEAMKNRPHEIDGKKVDPKRAVPKDDTNRGQSQISTQRLFVSGIKDTHTEDQLKEHFSQYGNVTKVDIPKDKTTDKMRGFAFITFDDYDPVDRCVLDKEHTIGDQKCQLKKGLTKDEMGKAQMGRDRMIRGDRSRGGGGRGAMGGGGGRGGFGRGGGQQAGWGQQAWGQQQGWDQYNQGGQWGGYGGGAQGQWGAAQQGGQYGQQAGWGRGY